MHIAAHAPRQRQAVALHQGQEQIAALEGVLGDRHPPPTIKERRELVRISGEDELSPAEAIELAPEVGLQLIAFIYP